MAVPFKKYEPNTAELTDLGTVKAVVGKGGKIAFIRKNYNNPEKRVAVIFTNAKGESATVSCSKQVSDALRKKEINVAQLAGLSVLENEEGIPFISMPATGGLHEVALDKVQTKEVAPVTANSLQDLIAW